MKLTGKLAAEGFQGVNQNHYIAGCHKIPRIWILTADPHKARIYRKPDGYLEQIGEATPAHFSKKMPSYALSQVINFFCRFIGQCVRPNHALNNKDRDFIQKLGNLLDHAVEDHAFDRLVLAASPKMLSDLGQILSAKVQNRIIAQVHKDFTKMTEKDLFEELKAVVWF